MPNPKETVRDIAARVRAAIAGGHALSLSDIEALAAFADTQSAWLGQIRQRGIDAEAGR